MLTELKSHALVQHFLTILRDAQTEGDAFRKASDAVTRIIVLEACKSLDVASIEVMTPLERTQGAQLSDSIVIVPILRAGIGMLQSTLEIIPGSAVGFIGLERNEATAIASCYYSKMPELTKDTLVFVVDPMLATGGSAIQTVSELKSQGVKRVKMLSIISAPEGIRAFQEAHPDVDIVTGVIDRELNELKYICPGLGDFGDRLFVT